MYERYVAIGDSQTEGLNDDDGRGGFIGWADRLADRIARVSPAVRYANLAVRGRVTGDVHREQLPAALLMQPDLVTVMSGVNDVRRPSASIPDAIELIDDMFRQLRQTGATVATCTFPLVDGRVPLGGRITPRIRQLNTGIRRAAHRYGVVLVDFEVQDPATDPRLWSEDRIHLNPVGHSVVAAAFADSLGLPVDGTWQMPSPPATHTTRLNRSVCDVRWLVRFVVPAVIRHAQGRSSGDGIEPKRPTLQAVDPAFGKERARHVRQDRSAEAGN